MLLKTITIPGGTFLMGSPENEEGSKGEERPQHEVTIKPFLMSKYPITQAQWRAVAALEKVNIDLVSDPSCFKGDNRPVECVSWYEAVEFCARLSNHTKKPYRLPSEAQWEYACRAGTTTPFYFGDRITTELANYCGYYAYGDGTTGGYQGETTKVGSFKIANAFGLHDMHGNVWEWCQDNWHDNYIDAPTDGSVWTGLSTGLSNDMKVLRGGSWWHYPEHCRSAYRTYSVADFNSNNIGFRVVCST
ncbi:MAG: formylglycine-generating enzyme family protein [Dolichospermum sp.]